MCIVTKLFFFSIIISQINSQIVSGTTRGVYLLDEGGFA